MESGHCGTTGQVVMGRVDMACNSETAHVQILFIPDNLALVPL